MQLELKRSALERAAGWGKRSHPFEFPRGIVKCALLMRVSRDRCFLRDEAAGRGTCTVRSLRVKRGPISCSVCQKKRAARHTSLVTRHSSHVTRHTSHASHVTRHTSHVTRHTSHVTRHTSHVTRHTSNVTRHSSHVTRHTSHVTRHTSHVTTHNTSHVTRHTSHVTCSFALFPSTN
jgi:hypothetical protein